MGIPSSHPFESDFPLQSIQRFRKPPFSCLDPLDSSTSTQQSPASISKVKESVGMSRRLQCACNELECLEGILCWPSNSDLNLAFYESVHERVQRWRPEWLYTLLSISCASLISFCIVYSFVFGTFASLPIAFLCIQVGSYRFNAFNDDLLSLTRNFRTVPEWHS